MTREMALPYVAYVVDDALAAREVGADAHAKVQPHSRLVGWQCGFEPLFVAVHSYLPDVTINDDEAIELATSWLEEIKWFSGATTEPDYVI